jgi:hypothetical protein
MFSGLENLQDRQRRLEKSRLSHGLVHVDVLNVHILQLRFAAAGRLELCRRVGPVQLKVLDELDRQRLRAFPNNFPA